jgi:predicted glutamine amidotransferase
VCKIAMVPKVTDRNRSDVWVFAQLLGELISQGNTDGLGYSAFDKQGRIFGEKWLINKTAFKDLTQIPGINSNKLENIYQWFGQEVIRDEAQAIILHTRAATCARGIANVHPFVDNPLDPKVALIHNGMIYNDRKFKKKYSTCDSEVLVPLYAENKVAASLSNLNEFTAKLEGWFTVLALSTDKDERMVIDAFSDNGRLGSYYIEELETRVYSSYASDVLRIATALGFHATDEQNMEADTAFRIDAINGEVLEKIKIKANIPVNVYGGRGMWDDWEPNVTRASGNLDDADFVNRWFGAMRGLPGYKSDM